MSKSGTWVKKNSSEKRIFVVPFFTLNKSLCPLISNEKKSPLCFSRSSSLPYQFSKQVLIANPLCVSFVFTLAPLRNYCLKLNLHDAKHYFLGSLKIPMLPQFGNAPKLKSSKDVKMTSIFEKGDQKIAIPNVSGMIAGTISGMGKSKIR